MDVYGCKEVTLRNPNYEANKERVDYVTFNTKGVIRCYEIKVTESDLNSKNKLSFWGDYNYLVLPKDLYNRFKHEKNATKCTVSIAGRVEVIESFARSASKQLMKTYY